MKALALLSGGLDSTLAVNIILKQGIEVEGINFFTPFCLCTRKNGCRNEAKKVTDSLGIKLKIMSISDDYLNMLKKPKHGYGKNLNPCIDCRILMHKKAKEYMQEIGASFIITGEVVGQRPMSQFIRALKIIEKESELEELVLRPLSAKLLPETIPERQGWVKRDKLLEINGRSRKIQMALAKDYGIHDYPCSAGGCLLTDAGFSRRMKDLMSHNEVTLSNIELLKIGRHFRLNKQAKVVVCRNEDENERVLRLVKDRDICFKPQDVKGPIGIGRGEFNSETINTASQIIARYCDNSNGKKIKIAIEDTSIEKVNYIDAGAMSDNQLETLRI